MNSPAGKVTSHLVTRVLWRAKNRIGNASSFPWMVLHGLSSLPVKSANPLERASVEVQPLTIDFAGAFVPHLSTPAILATSRLSQTSHLWNRSASDK